MITIYIAVAVLASLIVGALLCLVGFYLWTIRQTIIQLQKSVNGLQGTFSEVLGEGSFVRISKAVTVLSHNLPEMMEAFKEFSKVMKMFLKDAFKPEEVAAITAKDKESAFYGYDENRMGTTEAADLNNSKVLALTKEQLAGMRTESAE